MFQDKYGSTDRRGNLTIKVSFAKCSDADSENCLQSLFVEYKSTKLRVSVGSKLVEINGKQYSKSDIEYYISDLYAKMTTSTLVIKGFAFQITYDFQRAVCVTLDGEYLDKVSWCIAVGDVVKYPTLGR